MKTKNLMKSPWTYFAIIMILIGGFYVRQNITGNVIAPGQYSEFAQYLTDQGVIMYGTEWCGHCKNNKKLFGDAFQYVNFIDCDEQRQVCSDAGIRGYPTWEVNGKLYPGEQSLERLAALTNYEGTL